MNTMIERNAEMNTMIERNAQCLPQDYCIEAIAQALFQEGSKDGKSWKNNKGEWERLTCPICGGNALSIKPGDNGRPLLTCRSNDCDRVDIIKWIRARDLPFPEPEPRDGGRDGREIAEQRRLAALAKRRREEKEAAAHKEKALEAARLFAEMYPVKDAPTPYLESKRFTGDALNRLALAAAIRRDGDRLALALYDERGEISTLQWLSPNGGKRLLEGGRKKGRFHPIGINPEKLFSLRAHPEEAATLCLAEGWATGAAVYLSTGIPVIVTIDAGNMPDVARVIRDLAPEADIILCADDDETPDKPGNAGIKAAVEAARAVGGKVAYPRPQLPAEGLKVDFWDVWAAQPEAGPEAVRRAVAQAVEPADPAPIDGAAIGAKEEEPAPADEAAAFELELDRLAALSALEYERRRKGAAKRFGVDPTRVDKLVRERRTGDAAARPTEKQPFEETEPWPDPVNPAALLDEIETAIGRFIVCDPPVRTAAALWAAFTWFIDVVQVAPLALITAPEKSCGKSQLLDLFARLARRSMPTSSISPAALYRAIELWGPTLLIDEADAFMRDNEELRGVLNSGHTRSGAFVIRAVGDEHVPTAFSTWGAKAIAGIRADRLAATITDRSIVFPLRKKLKTEKVESLRGRDARELFPLLRRKLARFAVDAAETVERTDAPELEALTDRQMDNWEPLLALAQVAGGAWPEKTREAALALSRADDEPAGTGPELLANIHTVFQEQRLNPLASADKIATADLLEALCKNEEWRWATYNRGREIAARQVAAILKGYGIKTNSKIRVGEKSVRGYLKADFEDAFARYIPDFAPSPPFYEEQRNN